MRRLQIRQLLLLLIRMLIILMVVLAFARPTIRQGGVGAHASVSAVILLDNSASMNRYVKDGSLYEIARQRTMQLLETFGQSDRVCLIPLCPATDTEPQAFSSSAVARERLAALDVTSRAADLQTALERAVDLLAGAADINRELYVVTDRQRRSLPEQQLLDGDNVGLYLVDLPLEAAENLGIVSVDFGGQLIQPGHDFDVVATVKNYGREPGADLIASCFLDGRRVAQRDFEIPAGGEATVRFTRTVARTGFHSGYVEISDDGFLVDNRYYFTFRIPDHFNLLIVTGDETARFVSLALVPASEGSRYWSVKEAAPEELVGVGLDDYDVVMLAGAPSLTDSHVDRIRNFVKRGKSLFISYGGATNVDEFNRVWSEVSGVAIEESVRQTFTRAGYYGLQSVDLTHPIFSVFEFEDDQPPAIKFFTLPRVRVDDSARVVMRFTGDRPALVESRYGSGKVLTFAAPLSPYYGDLVSHGFFVPFISRIAEYLAFDLSSLEVHVFAGENITRSLSLAGSVAGPVELLTPDSLTYSIPPEEYQGALVVKARPADRAGVYRVNYRGREIDRFAVNVDPAECDLSHVDLGQLASALGASEHRPLGTDVSLASAISTYRLGRELWQIFLWIAAALLALEMVLGRGSPPEE